MLGQAEIQSEETLTLDSDSSSDVNSNNNNSSEDSRDVALFDLTNDSNNNGKAVMMQIPKIYIFCNRLVQ